MKRDKCSPWWRDIALFDELDVRLESREPSCDQAVARALQGAPSHAPDVMSAALPHSPQDSTIRPSDVPVIVARPDASPRPCGIRYGDAADPLWGAVASIGVADVCAYKSYGMACPHSCEFPGVACWSASYTKLLELCAEHDHVEIDVGRIREAYEDSQRAATRCYLNRNLTLRSVLELWARPLPAAMHREIAHVLSTHPGLSTSQPEKYVGLARQNDCTVIIEVFRPWFIAFGRTFPKEYVQDLLTLTQAANAADWSMAEANDSRSVNSSGWESSFASALSKVLKRQPPVSIGYLLWSCFFAGLDYPAVAPSDAGLQLPPLALSTLTPADVLHARWLDSAMGIPASAMPGGWSAALRCDGARIPTCTLYSVFILNDLQDFWLDGTSVQQRNWVLSFLKMGWDWDPTTLIMQFATFVDRHAQRFPILFDLLVANLLLFTGAPRYCGLARGLAALDYNASNSAIVEGVIDLCDGCSAALDALIFTKQRCSDCGHASPIQFITAAEVKETLSDILDNDFIEDGWVDECTAAIYQLATAYGVASTGTVQNTVLRLIRFLLARGGIWHAIAVAVRRSTTQNCQQY
ncbi:hypothetical protein NHJ13734_009568 [Beauveria thailandica]